LISLPTLREGEGRERGGGKKGKKGEGRSGSGIWIYNRTPFPGGRREGKGGEEKEGGNIWRERRSLFYPYNSLTLRATRRGEMGNKEGEKERGTRGEIRMYHNPFGFFLTLPLLPHSKKKGRRGATEEGGKKGEEGKEK